MIKHKKLALISPRDGFAGLLSDDEMCVTVIAPAAQKGRSIATGSYANRFPDSAVVEVSSAEEAIDQLAEYHENSLALDFTLLLFDREVNQQTRQDIARELNEMLSSAKGREYVLDIILAYPLPSEADSQGAADASKNWNRVRLLVDSILECQARVRNSQSAWLAMRVDPMVKTSGIESVHGALIQFGVFRRLAEEGKTKRDVDALRGEIVMNQGLTRRCDPRILMKFIADYSSHLPLGLRVASVASSFEPEVFSETDEISSHHNESPLRRPSADRQRLQAESQVQKIADLFGQGNDQLAEQFLSQLVESQTSNTSDYSHVVKSLCNIATKCAGHSRREISLKCLNRALLFPNGLDAVLYLQIGNALRDLGQYDNAINCYEKAKTLDVGERWDAIHLEYIRVVVAKGDYEKALQLYLQIPDIQYQSQAICSLGTLYRRMGNLRKARESYWRGLDIERQYHPAYAGLAEANKQSGRLDKAIERYNSILKTFPNLEEGSSKVYSLALSFLFRVTHQINRSKSLLTILHANYPRDCEVHLQLAKLFMLEGNSSQARHHFQQAQGPSVKKLALDLYLRAIGEPNGVQYSETLDIALPEDRGLTSCSLALAALETRDFKFAKEVLGSTRYVDRLQADFGAVLGFHAKKQLNESFDHKSEQIIFRIAKRGCRELRESVAAIEKGDFAEAQKMERRMCLLIA